MANLNTHDILNMKSDYGKRLASSIENSYDLKILDYTPIPEISLTSKKALIKTNRGTLFLKEKPYYSKKEDALLRSALFQDYCAKRSDNFVEIIKTKDKSHYLHFEGSVYFITPFVDSRSFMGDTDDFYKILKTLISLNNIGADFLKEKSIISNLFPQNKSYDIILSPSLFVNLIHSNEDKIIFNDLQESLKILTSAFDSLKSVDYVMSHGDCILFNFQILSDKAILHDFDNAKVLPKTHDIAEFFVSSCLLNYKANITNLKLPILLRCHKNSTQVLANEILKVFNRTEISTFVICVEIIWIWTLMLSVLKEDYTIKDLLPAIKSIQDRSLHLELKKIFSL